MEKLGPSTAEMDGSDAITKTDNQYPGPGRGRKRESGAKCQLNLWDKLLFGSLKWVNFPVVSI